MLSLTPGRDGGGTIAGKIYVVSLLLAVLLLLVAVAMTILGQFWVSQLGDLSAVGLASASAVYVLAGYRFRSVGATPVMSMVLAVLFSNAFLQVYEIVYGLSFLPALTGTELRTVILWFVMVLPVFLMRDYLKFDLRTSLPPLVLFAGLWIVWMLYGYPQYYFNGYPYVPFLKTDDPFHLALWLNFSSKAVLAVFFGSLLDPSAAIRNLQRRPWS